MKRAGDGLGKFFVRWRHAAFLVTARRFGPFAFISLEAKGFEKSVIDVSRATVVAGNGDDICAVLRRPQDQHSIVAVEMAATDVIECVAGQPVPSRSTALMLEFGQNAKRGLAPVATKRTQLAVRQGRQADFDHSA